MAYFFHGSMCRAYLSIYMKSKYTIMFYPESALELCGAKDEY